MHDAFLRFPHVGMPQRAGGFSLLEVLVATALLVLGIFGALALQATMVRAQRDAARHAEAVALAVELAALLARQPSVATWVGREPALADAPDCYQAMCTEASMAAFMVARWRWQADAVLPGWRAALDGAGGVRELRLTWPSIDADLPAQQLILPIDAA